MLFESRTYTFRPGTLSQFWEAQLRRGEGVGVRHRQAEEDRRHPGRQPRRLHEGPPR